MTTTICELKWIKGLLSSLGISYTNSMQLHCDSQSTLHIAINPIFHKKNKTYQVIEMNYKSN
ncbi:hypothetical protein CR513_33988, partial [Mucuna pruriens]